MGIDELYQGIVLDHYRNPRNSADLSYISDETVHENPTCGDSVKIDVVVDNGKIEKLAFEGRGCAISVASASMMTELLSGRSVDEARKIITDFKMIMRGEADRSELDKWGDLAALSGVIDFPLRVNCAILAWRAVEAELEAALK